MSDHHLVATACLVAAAVWVECAIFLVRRVGMDRPDPAVHPSHRDYVRLWLFDSAAAFVLGLLSPLLLSAMALGEASDAARRAWARVRP